MAESKPLALVTGASSGIGLALAIRLIKTNHRLLVSARASGRFDAAVEMLRALPSAEVEMHCDDLSDSSAAGRLFAALNGRTPDVLVNNAGFGTHGAFAESEPESQLAMIGVNITSLVHLTRLCLPNMIARRSGRILNVSSTASFQPGPYMATYYASKAFVTSFSRAINHELRRTGVTVTALCPGPTTTDFQNRAGVADTPLFRNNTMTVDAVADIGYAAMKAGKPLVICGTKNKLLAIAVKLAPVSIATKIAGKLNSNR